MTVKTRNKMSKKRKVIIIISIILAVVLLIVGTGFALMKAGERKLREQLSFGGDGMSKEEAYGDIAEVYHNGQGYVYNENLINVLCIGVDKKNIKEKKDRQADVLYLFSLDTEAHKLNVIPISRNTITDIDIYDMNNQYLSTDRAQVCLSYVYGKDDVQSAELTSKAVSRLLYDVPINSYCTFFTDSLIEVVDTIGGVPVVVPEDMTGANPSWRKGAKITLNSKNALKFVRYRDDTNQQRMKRQGIFIESFAGQLKSAVFKNVSLPVQLFKKLSSSLVTDMNTMSITYLASETVASQFAYHNITGEVGNDGTYETFVADDEALYELVLNLFYIKTN